jgi:Hemerythrin HHE cation binding domain
MSEKKLDVAAALGRAHTELLKDLGALEAAVTTPALDPPALVKRLEATSKCITEHFRLEEKNGYMENIRSRAPHLGHTIDKLKEEHALLLSSMNELLGSARHVMGLDNALRATIRELVERVLSHETRENLLVEDAYNRETGDKD